MINKEAIIHDCPPLQEKVEDSGSGSGALPVLQAQEQAPSSGLTPRVHPPMAAGTQISNSSSDQLLIDY